MQLRFRQNLFSLLFWYVEGWYVSFISFGTFVYLYAHLYIHMFVCPLVHSYICPFFCTYLSIFLGISPIYIHAPVFVTVVYVVIFQAAYSNIVLYIQACQMMHILMKSSRGGTYGILPPRGYQLSLLSRDNIHSVLYSVFSLCLKLLHWLLLLLHL